MNVNLAIARNAAIYSKLSISTGMREQSHRVQPEVVVFANEHTDEEGTHLRFGRKTNARIQIRDPPFLVFA